MMAANDPLPATGAQSSSGDGNSIQVFVRVRPPARSQGVESAFDQAQCLEVESNNVIRMACRPEPKVFTFDQVADIDTAQETVFGAVGKKITESCFAGYNGTIFAYGQTGSGKTFTMLGPADHTENFQHEMRGVIPRSFEYLFNLVRREQELKGESVQFLCKCSFLEIYNEQVFDLLDPASKGLQLRENIKRGVFVDGLIEESVTDASEAYQVLTSGWLNRTVASTAMNRESSRSHAVFTVHIESKVNNGGVWNVRSSQLNLVDLAGSERQKDTQTAGLRLKEATSINRSLSTLGNVIMALVDITHGKTRHVPYRDSKLSFLLRDSLGGNAKTYIIACVHPGSKCFGETLSTLQFARRAKMIKNKAVVNEDLHGNVTSLQSEIRRLKDTIAQYQAGQIPLTPTAGSGEATPVAASDSKWRQHFLEAMFFRQRVIDDKQLVVDKLRRAEELCTRKEQALRQNKMILRFREDALKKYERAHKDKAEMGDDDKEAVISSLRSEIQTWQSAMDQHPEVFQGKVQIENLRAEITRLRAQPNLAKVIGQRSTQLDASFKQLMAEKEKDRLRSAVGDSDSAAPRISTPPTNTDNISVATIDRHKSQIAKLQMEVENCRRDLLAEREDTAKVAMETAAQLVATRKAKEELEKTLRAHQVKSQVERETFEELHMETLKTMTTPKKSGYHLRSRTVMVPRSAAMGGTGDPGDMMEVTLDESFSEDDLITQQQVPTEVTEEKIEALTDEIKKIQEENRILHAQLDSQESEIIHQVEEKSRVECQKGLLEERYTKEQAAWASRETELTERGRVLEAQLKHVTEEKDVARGEVQDLRIMYESTEKRGKESRSQLTKVKDAREKEVAALETKKMQLEVELTKVQKSLQVAQEEQTTLRETEENLTATLNFTQERLSQAEESLISANRANQDLQARVLSIQTCLEQEEERTNQLGSQLQQEGDKEERLGAALTQLEAQRKALVVAQSLSEVADSKVTELQAKVKDATETIDRMTGTAQESKDMISTLSATIGELRDALEDKSHQMALLSECRDELSAANDDLVTDNERLRTAAEDDGRRHREEINVLNTDVMKIQSQYEILQEDLDENMEKNGSLESDLAASQQEKADISANLEESVKQLELLKKENFTLSNTIGELKQTLDLTTSSGQRSESVTSDMAAGDNIRISFLKYRQSFELLAEQKNALTADNDTLKDKVKEISAQLTAMDAESRQLKAANERLRLEMDVEYNTHRDREVGLQCKMSELEEVAHYSTQSVIEACRAQEIAEALAKQATSENERLTDFLDVAMAESGERQVEVNRLRGILEEKQSECEDRQRDLDLALVENATLHKSARELEDKFTEAAGELALLSGHQNTKQKIKYVAKLHEEKNELQLKYNNLLVVHNKLKVRLETMDLDGKRTTPHKRLLHPSGRTENVTPDQRKVGTPTSRPGKKDPGTPIRMDKLADSPGRSLEAKENVIPEDRVV